MVRRDGVSHAKAVYASPVGPNYRRHPPKIPESASLSRHPRAATKTLFDAAVSVSVERLRNEAAV